MESRFFETSVSARSEARRRISENVNKWHNCLYKSLVIFAVVRGGTLHVDHLLRFYHVSFFIIICGGFNLLPPQFVSIPYIHARTEYVPLSVFPLQLSSVQQLGQDLNENTGRAFCNLWLYQIIRTSPLHFTIQSQISPAYVIISIPPMLEILNENIFA